MIDGEDDYKRLINQKRFLGEMEQGIRQANRNLIHERIPSINQDSVLELGEVVAQLRAHYLEAAFKLGKDVAADQPKILELKTRREMYEEARTAFEALREAIEKGYVDVDGTSGERRTFDRPD